ncbi:MAG: haloacid dehalogenase-like hydrolase, partial [Clostridia bacterium]|nr:haloacid dehalogenase-like hydrolase [Clostridia bacterium]
MKKLLTALLLIVMLCQALPMSAFATVGKVLSAEELARAYALTGLGDGNGAYHEGMKPNASWNAAQLLGYLDDKLSVEVYNLGDTIARANYALAELEQSDPVAHRGFTASGATEKLQRLSAEAEALREEMRYYEKRLTECSGVIAEMGRILQESPDSMFDSDKVRYSARIEEAAANLVADRQTILENVDAWEDTATRLRDYLQYGGKLTGDKDGLYVGDALAQLFTADAPVSDTAKVTAVTASNSRLSRLAAGAGFTSNDGVDVEIDVLSENEIGITFGTERDGKRYPVVGLPYTIHDKLNPEGATITGETNSKGNAIFPSNQFTTDEYDCVPLKLAVDGEAMGYRSILIDDLDLDLGTIFEITMIPLGESANAAGNGGIKPYLKSAQFGSKDILHSNYQIIYSPANNYEFEIKVEVSHAENQPELIMTWYENDGGFNKLKKRTAKATSHVGNVYIFKGMWKQKFSPNAAKNQRPTFSFGEGEDAVSYTSRLVSVRAATDQPINEGTGGGGGVFGKVLSELGFGADVHIGKHTFHIGLNVALPKYVPKLNINVDGSVTAWIGSDVFSDKVKKSKLNWQHNNLKELTRAYEALEKTSFIGNYMAKAGVAYDYYTNRRARFIASTTLQLGVFAVATGRWQLDNNDPDVKTKLVTLRAGAGFTVTFAFNFGWIFTVGPIPVNITFTVGINAGVGFDFQLEFCWVDGEFHGWKPYALREIELSFGIIFSAQLGIGIKDFLEAYARFTANLNVLIRLFINDQTPNSVVVTYAMSLTVGVTVFFVNLSDTWTFKKGQLYPKNESANLLAHYMNDGADDADKVPSAYQEPQDYPGLQPDMANLLDSVADAKDEVKLVTVGDNTYAFYLALALGSDDRPHWRVHWKRAGGDIQCVKEVYDALGAADDYAFDVATSDGFIYLMGLRAEVFDENGMPVPHPGGDIDGRVWEYFVMLEPDASGRLTTNLSAADSDGNHDWHIEFQADDEWIKTKIDLVHTKLIWSDEASRRFSYVSFYAQTEFVRYDEKKGQPVRCACGWTTDASQSRTMEHFYDDAIGNSFGDPDQHERVKQCTTLLPPNADLNQASEYNHSLPFVALTSPIEGRTGESAIEYFDWDMNLRHVNNHDVSAVALAKGDIDGFEVVSALGPDGVVNTVFYVDEEKSEEGDVQYRLKGLRIEPFRRSEDGLNCELEVTKYDYDLTIPGGKYEVGYIGAAPYLYWWSASPAPDDENKVVWRIWGVAYDGVSNTMADTIVLAQFELPVFHLEHGIIVPDSNAQQGEADLGRHVEKEEQDIEMIPADILLTASGTGYLVGRAVEAAKWEDRPRFAIYAFPERIQPLADLQTALAQQTLVKPGSFDDIDVGVMNTGNVPLSAIDIALKEVDGAGNEGPVVETAHINLHEPDKSRLTMGDGSVPLSGAAVGHRAEDYDYSPRQRDFIHSQERGVHNLRVDRYFEYKGYEVKDESTRHLTSDLLMPGSLADIMAAFKIPEGWTGAKKLRLRISGITIESNWLRAMASTAGLASNAVGDGNDSVELVYKLNPKTGKLELQMPAQANSAVKNAIESGLYANEVEAGKAVDLMVTIHDIDVDHRVYTRWDGQDWLSISVKNHAATGDALKLVCAVYVDGSEEPYYLNLPYYRQATSARRTHNFTLPLSALVDDPDAHDRVRVVISAVDTDENAYANNEFTVYLGGSDELRFKKQPESVTAQAGEDVTFDVEVAGGTKPYAYQWQVYNPKTGKWVDLKGFTDPTISREKIESKWDGAWFRCVVTDASGKTIVSEVATLTVRDAVDTGDHSNLPLYLTVALIALLLALAMATAGFAVAEEAPTVENGEAFSQWNPDAPALNALVEYVEAVTDPDSPDFIPEADRVATCDMDGTLMAELAPTYLEVMLLTERILRDPSYEPDEEMLACGRMTRDHALDKSFPDDYDYEFSYHQAKAFAGMTIPEYADFITRFLVREADGFTGMTYADAYYLPMAEVVDYLRDNGFRCYVVSGSDRFIVRAFIEGAFDIPADNIIGSDTALEARNQGDTDGIEYVFTGDDELVRTDKLIIKDLKTNKVVQIAQEIGQQPVLSFGNSGGDVSMNNYALLNNRYRSAAFMVMADDDARDYGSADNHDTLTEKWAGMGYNVISMRDDWKTIYGTDVHKTGAVRWLREYADPDPVEENYALEQMVILSRHNLRAPLSSNGSVPSELTPHEWIQWSAGSSELTLLGGVEETSMGQYFRKWLDAEGLIPENYVPE